MLQIYHSIEIVRLPGQANRNWRRMKLYRNSINQTRKVIKIISSCFVKVNTIEVSLYFYFVLALKNMMYIFRTI